MLPLTNTTSTAFPKLFQIKYPLSNTLTTVTLDLGNHHSQEIFFSSRHESLQSYSFAVDESRLLMQYNDSGVGDERGSFMFSST